MESEARYTLVGAVVLALAALAAIGAFWFSYAGEERELVSYRIYFRQQSLSGLQVGSIVSMRGIKIGNVKSFKILPDENKGVEVVIAVDPAAPIRTSTTAVVDRNLLTGLAGIELKTEQIPGTMSPLMKDSGQSPDAPLGKRMYVINEGRVPLREIAESAEDILKSLNDTLKDIRRLVSEENRQHITGILRSVDEVMAAVSKEREGFARIPGHVDRLAADLHALLESASKLVTGLDSEVHQFTESVKLIVAATGNSVRNVGDRVGTAAENFEDPTQILFGPNPNKFGPGER